MPEHRGSGGLNVSVSTEYVGLLDGEAHRGEHYGIAIVGDEADVPATLKGEVR